MLSSVKSMGIVCGWVVLFRIIVTFLQSWCLWLLPRWGQILVIGLLELSNGCCELSGIIDMEGRFILCSCMLAFGGICVILQTASVIKGLSLSGYIKGKILQTIFSALICCAITFENGWFYACSVPIVLLIFRNSKKWYRNNGLLPV